MKLTLMWAIITVTALTFNTFSVSAKDIPTGMKIEIVEVEQDDNEFEIFTYKDEDGTFGYYLGIGYELRISDLSEIQIFGGSLSHIDEVCLCMGETPEEVADFLNSLHDAFDREVNDVIEFSGRLTTGADRLAGPTKVVCIVKKKFLGGKYLQFHFTSGKHNAEAVLSKSVVKQLKKGFKIGK